MIIPLRLLALCLAFASQQHPPTRVSIQYEDGRVYVPVYDVEGGAGNSLGWFILDTGAGPTVLDRAVALRLGIRMESAGRQSGAGAGAVDISTADGRGLRVGDVAYRPSRLVVLSLDSLLGPSSGRHIAGIIGSQFFREHTVELLDHQAMWVDPADADGGGSLPRTGLVSLPLDLTSGLPTIDASVRLGAADTAATSLRLHIDLGAKAPMLLSEDAYRRLAGENRIGARTHAWLGAGVGGDTEYDFVLATALRAGSPAVTLADSLVVGLSANGTLRMAGADGLLGAPFLMHYALLIDFAHARLWLAPGANSTDASALTRFDMSGLFLASRAASDGSMHTIIEHVEPDSPASRAGVLVGDELIAVDGVAVLGTPLAQVRSLLSTGPARGARLTVRHGSTELSLTLQLRRLVR